METDSEQTTDTQNPAAAADAEVEAPAADAQGAEQGLEAAEASEGEAGFPEGFDEAEWEDGVDAAYLQSKYTLVSVAAKRARQILAGSQRRVESLSEKPVTVALEELSAGKLYFERIGDRTR